MATPILMELSYVTFPQENLKEFSSGNWRRMIDDFLKTGNK
jgi:hypothetical protein